MRSCSPACHQFGLNKLLFKRKKKPHTSYGDVVYSMATIFNNTAYFKVAKITDLKGFHPEEKNSVNCVMTGVKETYCQDRFAIDRNIE